MASLYETLGVASDATFEQISEAYRSHLEMAKSQGDLSNAASVNLFAIKEAYGVLASPDRRRAYDRKLANDNAPKANETATPAKTTLYEILGVTRDATPEQISQAYKSRAEVIDNQRDLASGTSVDLFAIKEAYGVLSSPDRRKAYDRALANRSASNYREFIAPRPTPPWRAIAVITLIFLVVFVYLIRNHEKPIPDKRAEYEPLNAKANSETMPGQELVKVVSISTQKDVDQDTSKGRKKPNDPILAAIDYFEVVAVNKHSATIKVVYSHAPSLTKQFIGGTASSSNGLVASSTGGQEVTANDGDPASNRSTSMLVQSQDLLELIS